MTTAVAHWMLVLSLAISLLVLVSTLKLKNWCSGTQIKVICNKTCASWQRPAKDRWESMETTSNRTLTTWKTCSTRSLKCRMLRKTMRRLPTRPGSIKFVAKLLISLTKAKAQKSNAHFTIWPACLAKRRLLTMAVNTAANHAVALMTRRTLLTSFLSSSKTTRTASTWAALVRRVVRPSWEFLAQNCVKLKILKCAVKWSSRTTLMSSVCWSESQRKIKAVTTATMTIWWEATRQTSNTTLLRFCLRVSRRATEVCLRSWRSTLTSEWALKLYELPRGF